MVANKPIIFLSYTRKDTPKVRVLYKKLKNAGFNPWMDVEDLVPGEDWELVVKEQIKQASFFLACLSQNAVNHRGIVQTELREALEVAKEKLDDDIYFIPARLDACQVPQRIRRYNWVNLFEQDGFEKLVNSIAEGMRRFGIFQLFRSQPIDRISELDVKEALKKGGFFDNAWNKQATGLQHQYVSIQPKGFKLITDHSTGLTWQKSGSRETMNFSNAQLYIQQVNSEVQGGYTNWRLPTIEEAMSLMEPQKENEELHIHPEFNPTQRWIWTADRKDDSFAWVVNFSNGRCYNERAYINYFVRAVRSVAEPI